MNSADFDELSESEKKHFYQCSRCGEMVHMRQLDEVFHETDHKPRPGYSIRRFGRNRRMNPHVFECLMANDAGTFIGKTTRKKRRLTTSALLLVLH
jgi:hypothetical protein